ncbi:MAG: hypothetical protein ACFFAS_15625 [Promethearchaeota archaeon]
MSTKAIISPATKGRKYNPKGILRSEEPDPVSRIYVSKTYELYCNIEDTDIKTKYGSKKHNQDVHRLI